MEVFLFPLLLIDLTRKYHPFKVSIKKINYPRQNEGFHFLFCFVIIDLTRKYHLSKTNNEFNYPR